MSSKRPYFSPRRASGFTLIEVLAALLLVAVLLPVLMGGVQSSLKLGALARDRMEVTRLAETQLNTLIVTGDWETQSSGDFNQLPGDPPRRDYRWTLETADWETQALQQITFTVTWERGGKEHVETFTTAVHVEGGA